MITQEEFELLHQIEKYLDIGEVGIEWPKKGKNLAVPCYSKDNRESFEITINRGKIEVRKINYQQLYSQDKSILFRIDNIGPRHQNPDGNYIDCPHIHIYKEGYGDKWAYSLNEIIGIVTENPIELFEAFLKYINVTDTPHIEYQLELVNI